MSHAGPQCFRIKPNKIEKKKVFCQKIVRIVFLFAYIQYFFFNFTRASFSHKSVRFLDVKFEFT